MAIESVVACTALTNLEWTIEFSLRFFVFVLCFYGLLLAHKLLQWLTTSSALDAKLPHGTNAVSSSTPRGYTPPQRETDDVMQSVREFEAACRTAFNAATNNTTADSGVQFMEAFEDGLAFVKAICEGIAGFPCKAEIVKRTSDGPSLRVLPRTALRGDFATRSRIPYSLNVSEDGVSFRLSNNPPNSSCPFRCACHKRCFGPASGGQGSWAEISIVFQDGRQRTLEAALQAFSPEHASLAGIRLVHVQGNRFGRSVDVQGAAAIVTEKHKPGTTSDGAVAREAQEAGARCLIKLGGGGELIFCVADPVGIPCIAIREEDGRSLIDALKQSGGARIVSVKEHDRRSSVMQDRWGRDTVFVHVTGLHLSTVDSTSPLCASVQSRLGRSGPLIYEDFFEYYKDHKDTNNAISPESSKLRRIIQSAWTHMERLRFTSNPAMLGKLLALGGQRFRFAVQHVRFNPGKTQNGIVCTMLLIGTDSQQGIYQGDGPSFPTPSDAQAWVAHESVYLALMGQFTKLIGYVAPSLWNFIKCTNGEFFPWEADSKKMLKLFTACSGPVGPEPNETWQRCDPTWRIVDEKNAIGIVTRSQGRVLWTAMDSEPSVVVPPGRNKANSFARILTRCACMT